MDEVELIDMTALARARAEIGPQIGRIVGYFREDGIKSVAAITAALRTGDAAGIVRPAHTLKGESRQLGAEALGELCEVIEHIGRDCIESHETPDQAIEHIARLKPMFEATLAILEHETRASFVERRVQFGGSAGGFGRRATDARPDVSPRAYRAPTSH